MSEEKTSLYTYRCALQFEDMSSRVIFLKFEIWQLKNFNL